MQSQNEIDLKNTKQEVIDFSRFQAVPMRPFVSPSDAKNEDPQYLPVQSLGAVAQTVLKL